MGQYVNARGYVLSDGIGGDEIPPMSTVDPVDVIINLDADQVAEFNGYKAKILAAGVLNDACEVKLETISVGVNAFSTISGSDNSWLQSVLGAWMQGQPLPAECTTSGGSTSGGGSIDLNFNFSPWVIVGVVAVVGIGIYLAVK